jgi:hypothetical protein
VYLPSVTVDGGHEQVALTGVDGGNGGAVVVNFGEKLMFH